jgi:hypothetical protein
VGVDPTDHVAGLPPVDSNDFWPSILVPHANASGRDEIFLSYSCTAPGQHGGGDASGCDLEATSKYGTKGDPTGGQASGDMALISGAHKIIFGAQQGRGIWFGPVFPNGTKDAPAYPCVDGCLFDIFKGTLSLWPLSLSLSLCVCVCVAVCVCGCLCVSLSLSVSPSLASALILAHHPWLVWLWPWLDQTRQST